MRDHRPTDIVYVFARSTGHGPYPIYLKFEDTVMFPIGYEDALPSAAEVLSEYDINGRALVRVPVTDCIFFDEEGARDMVQSLQTGDPLILLSRFS